jgi:hypothetical protein
MSLSLSPEQEEVGTDTMEDQTPTLPVTLADSLTAYTGAVFSSAGASRLMLFPSQRDDEAAATGGQGVRLADFQFDVIVGQVNPLIHAWHAIFCQLRAASATGNPRNNPQASVEAWHMHLLGVSRAYRAELEACLTTAAAEIQGGSVHPALKAELRASNVSLEDYKFHLILLETCKSLFHLMEIFYIDPHLNLTVQLVDWIHRTLQAPEVDLQALKEEEEQAQLDGEPWTQEVMHDAETYWNVVYRLLLQGRLYEASQLLQTCVELTHRESEYARLMHEVVKAIETVPALAHQEGGVAGAKDKRSNQNSNKYAGEGANVPLDQFIYEFNQWKLYVQTLLTSPILTDHPHPHLELLLQVLLGDASAIFEVSGANYLEAWCAHLIYIKPFSLSSSSQRGLDGGKKELAGMLESVMEECERRWKESRKEERQARLDAKADGGAMEEEGEAEEETEEDIANSTLFTPLDTLRYHLISSDITAALNTMNTMLDLKFFMAHVVHLLGEQGEIIHLEHDESMTAGGLPLPLRLQHSPIASSITLTEHYLLSYGESLESASTLTRDGAEAGGAAVGDLWQMAAEYYAACPEHGRGFLSELLKRQVLTVTLEKPLPSSTNPSGSVFQQPTSQHAVRWTNRTDTKKVHKLLALATKYGMREEYNHIADMAGVLSLRLARESLVIASDAASTRGTGALFGQAAFWFGLIQAPVGEECNGVAKQAQTRLEQIAETLLDELLLPQHQRSSKSSNTRIQAASEGLRGLLSHTPSSLLIPLSSVSSSSLPSAVLPSGTSGLLSFAAELHAYAMGEQRRLEVKGQVREEVRREMEKAEAGGEQGGNQNTMNDDDAMADIVAQTNNNASPTEGISSSSSLASLLSLHSHLHALSLLSLLSQVTSLPVVVPHHKRWWIGRIQEAVERAEEENVIKGTEDEEQGVAGQQKEVSWFDLDHPSLTLPTTLPSPASSPLTLPVLTQIQKLFTSLTKSSTAERYVRTIGGEAEARKVQQKLSALTHRVIRQQHTNGV